MSINLKNRHFLTLLGFDPMEIRSLLNLSSRLKNAKREKKEVRYLEGKNIALIFEKDSTRTRCAFEVAAHDQGAHVTYLGSVGSQIGHKETMKDTARVLGRLYDGIEYRGFAQNKVATLAKYAGVPIWNGLTNEYHPTQILADLLTMEEISGKDLSDISFCYLGDARNNVANSLLIGGAKMGMDVRIAAPSQYQPNGDIEENTRLLGKETGANILITDNVSKAVHKVDFLYTDVWVSMGEPDTIWDERINLLMPYQVNQRVVDQSQNSEVKFMHCLPAFHNRDTAVGEKIFQKFGLEALEVSEEVFESDASVVFQQAENRMHTIKAVMVATLGEI